MANFKKKKFNHPFLEKVHGEFTWCLHCERVSRTELWLKNNWDCPAKGCDGSALDAHSWNKGDWPLECNPDYPEIPVVGATYPLYGKNNKFQLGL